MKEAFFARGRGFGRGTERGRRLSQQGKTGASFEILGSEIGSGRGGKSGRGAGAEGCSSFSFPISVLIKRVREVGMLLFLLLLLSSLLFV